VAPPVFVNTTNLTNSRSCFLSRLLCLCVSPPLSCTFFTFLLLFLPCRYQFFPSLLFVCSLVGALFVRIRLFFSLLPPLMFFSLICFFALLLHFYFLCSHFYYFFLCWFQFFFLPLSLSLCCFVCCCGVLSCTFFTMVSCLALVLSCTFFTIFSLVGALFVRIRLFFSLLLRSCFSLSFASSLSSCTFILCSHFYYFFLCWFQIFFCLSLSLCAVLFVVVVSCLALFSQWCPVLHFFHNFFLVVGPLFVRIRLFSSLSSAHVFLSHLLLLLLHFYFMFAFLILFLCWFQIFFLPLSLSLCAVLFVVGLRFPCVVCTRSFVLSLRFSVRHVFVNTPPKSSLIEVFQFNFSVQLFLFEFSVLIFVKFLSFPIVSTPLSVLFVCCWSFPCCMYGFSVRHVFVNTPPKKVV